MGCFVSKSAETIDSNDKTQCIVKNTSSSFVPEIISEKISGSILRIEFEKKISTGFFIKINLNKNKHNFILTCAHSISQEDINSKITITIFYGKANKETEQKIKLDINERFIKCFMNFDIDATILEVLQEDNIPEDKYLYPDLNYENGYDQYIGNQIFTGGYPEVSVYKGDKHFSSGNIKSYKDKKKINFCHTCATKEGSSGSPLININQQVIGIHYGCNNQQTINHGTFIGEIIKNLTLEQDKIILKEYEFKSNEKSKEQGDEEINNKEDEKLIINKNKKIVNKDNETFNKIKKAILSDEENEKLSNQKVNIINNRENQKENNKDNMKIVHDKNQNDVLNNDENDNKNGNLGSTIFEMFMNNPSNITPFFNFARNMITDPQTNQFLKSIPEFQETLDLDPIGKKLMDDPELARKMLNPDMFNQISPTFNNPINDINGIKENEINNGVPDKNNNEENLINNINKNSGNES